MKTMLAVVILLMGTGMAFGNEDNQRVDCNRKAEGTTGAERNRIISACVRRNARTNTMPPMLGKMTECNRKAGDMTGDARITFVDKCLKEP